jgi:vitellogenic carboxypeptidase-like protein
MPSHSSYPFPAGPYGPWFMNVSGSDSYFNIVDPTTPPEFGYSDSYVTQTFVRSALGVGNTTYNDGNLQVEISLAGDIFFSQKPNIGMLLDAGYKVLIYNGVLDIICGAPLTDLYVPTIPWSGAPDYASSPRAIWREPGTGYLAGWARQAGNLTRVTVRSAGHIAPFDQPFRTQDMITRFIEGAAWD